MNRATYSSGQGNGQQHIKMYDSRQSTRSAYFDFCKTTPHQANLYRHNYIRLSSYKEHQCLIAGKGVGLQKAARNEAFEQHYKAICLAGKSEGIEALKQDTNLNTAFERKSVVRIECIWVFSMPCTHSLALQGPCILARVRDIDFRLLESTGISKEASYGNGELRSGLKTVEFSATTPSVGRNSVRINSDCENLPQIGGIQCDDRNSKSGKVVETKRVPNSLAIFPGNPSTDSVKEGPETVEFSPRLTPWEGIQPKIVIHPLKPPEFTPRTGIQPNRINIPQSSA
ncbi:hypothetical protein R3P38DRAFT_2808369 [Favolaschia claudopus]|uniref:Uncharacterized protein n=1 Tax=Favolaschia claudopus TaxID=2862362 RepID=A0AAV9ZGR4_9AGAR